MIRKRTSELQRLQELREQSTSPSDIERYQRMIDDHFMGVKTKKKKKKKKVITENDWYDEDY